MSNGTSLFVAGGAVAVGSALWRLVANTDPLC